MPKEDFDLVKKDFEIFSKGIERLEELRAELESLDVKGFEKEASAIKCELKNVSAIPRIEQQLEELRMKIAKRRGRSGKGDYNPLAMSKLASQIADIKETLCNAEPKQPKKAADLKSSKQLSTITKQLSQLRGIITQLEKGREKPLTQQEIAIINEIPLIEHQVKELKEAIIKLQKKNRGLTKQEKAHIDGIPKVELQLGDLKRAIEAIHQKSISELKELPKIEREIRELKEEIRPKKIPIKELDYEVGSLVEKEFKEFLIGIKSELSQRVKQKETALDDSYDYNLQKLQEAFKAKQDEMAAVFSERFDNKIKSELKKEIDARFNKALEEKLDAEKLNLSRKFDKRLKDAESEQRNKLNGEFRTRMQEELNKLKQGYAKKKEILEIEKDEEIKKKEALLAEQIRSRLSAELKKDADVKLKEKEIELKKELDKSFMEELNKEMNSLGPKLREQLKEEFLLKQKEFERNLKRRMDAHYAEKIKSKEIGLRQELESQSEINLKREKEIIRAELLQKSKDKEKELKEELAKKFEAELAQRLKDKENDIREELNKKFKSLLKL